MKVLPQQAQNVTDIFTPKGVDFIYNYLNGKGNSPVTSREISISQIQNAIIFLLWKKDITVDSFLKLSESVQAPSPRIEYGIRVATEKLIKSAVGIDREKDLRLKALGEGDKVMVSWGSSYVKESDEVGTLMGSFLGKYMEDVVFENWYQGIFSRRDLVSTEELQEIEKTDRKTFAEKLIKDMVNHPSFDVKVLKNDIEIGDNVEVENGWRYRITTKGSKWKVVNIHDDSIDVQFSYLSSRDSQFAVGKIYEIDKTDLKNLKILSQKVIKQKLRKVIDTTLTKIQFDFLDRDTKTNIIENASKKLIENGLVIPIHDTDSYALNFSEISKFTSPQLESIYTNPELFSTSVMFEPPAERLPNVLRLQLTDGCDYNKCTFCGGFNGVHHAQKTTEEFIQHSDKVIEALGSYKHPINRVFLGSGNGLDVEQEELEMALEHVKKSFKNDLKRVAVYGTSRSILNKTYTDLCKLYNKWLKCIYWWIESGSDEVLKYVRKGSTHEEMMRVSEHVRGSYIDLSAMIMPGLGGKRLSKEHAQWTIDLINSINCKYLTLMSVNPGEKSIYQRIMNQEIERGENRPLTDVELVKQVRYIIQGLDVNSNMKIGMYGEEIDAVGKNPISFNAEFSWTGKQTILAICDEYLETHKDTEHPEDMLIEEDILVMPEITTVEKEIEENISELPEVSIITSPEEMQQAEEVTARVSKNTIWAKFKKFVQGLVLFH